MEKNNYNENQSIFRVGESPDKMYLLVKGSVGIFLPTNETNKPNFIIQENELFGEMGVIENELRMATARCLVESEIISITKDEFDQRVNNLNDTLATVAEKRTALEGRIESITERYARQYSAMESTVASFQETGNMLTAMLEKKD